MDHGRISREMYDLLRAMNPDTVKFVDPKPVGDSVAVMLHLLGEPSDPWKYALVEVPDSSHWGASELYFLHDEKLIAATGVFHRHRLMLEHFMTSQGRKVICYNEVFAVGTGLSQSNTFCYGLDGDTLRPLVNLLRAAGSNGGLGGVRWWDITSHRQGIDPLVIRYETEDMWSGPDTAVIYSADSTRLEIDWEKAWTSPSYRSIASADVDVWSYQAMESHSFDLLYIASHPDVLLAEWNHPDTMRRRTVRDYLNCVRRAGLIIP